jgi:hypothetical protein
VAAASTATGGATSASDSDAGAGGKGDDGDDAPFLREFDRDPVAVNAFLTQLLNEGLQGVELVNAVNVHRTVVQNATTSVASVPVPLPQDCGATYPLALPLRLMEEASLVVSQGLDKTAAACKTAAATVARQEGIPVDASAGAAVASATTLTPLENAALLAGPIASRAATGATAAHQLPQCIRSITYSGWNPPPAARRMQGEAAGGWYDPIPASHSWICCTPTQHANSPVHRILPRSHSPQRLRRLTPPRHPQSPLSPLVSAQRHAAPHKAKVRHPPLPLPQRLRRLTPLRHPPVTPLIFPVRPAPRGTPPPPPFKRTHNPVR